MGWLSWKLLRFPCWFYFFSDLNMTFKFHADNTIPSGDWIWVFASNEAGKHGKGQARIARVNFRAEFGVGRGPTGHAYAIATQDRHLELLSLAVIEISIGDFLSYARIHSELNFFETRVACKGSSAGTNGSGEVGYSDDQIGPLFARAPENCSIVCLTRFWSRPTKRSGAGWWRIKWRLQQLCRNVAAVGRPRSPVLSGCHPSIASLVNQIVMSPRRRNASLYSGQLVTLYLGLVNLWRRVSLCL